jgi:hypothetical protein
MREMGHLRDAIEAATTRKTYKLWHIRNTDILRVSEISGSIDAREGRSCKEEETPAKRAHVNMSNQERAQRL